MSVPAREFTFSVDTDEVATTMVPPAPVIAQPKRRPTAPTVVLRLPNLTTAPVVEPAPVAAPAAPVFTPWVAPEISFSLPPKPEMATAPMPTMSFPMLQPMAAPSPEAVTEMPAPAPTSQVITAHTPTVLDPRGANADEEPLWKNPKFMLAGVAAAFLGMVSLIAMNHEESKPTEEAPPWNGANTVRVEMPESDSQTPLVVRGQETAPTEWTPEPFDYNAHADVEEDEASHRASPTTLFADRSAAPDHYSPPAQDTWAQENSAPSAQEEMEGAARLAPPLPNFYDRDALEASHTEPGYPPSTR